MVGFTGGMPDWLETMLGERFFNPCMIHEAVKKNEKNVFCLDCCSSFCPQCLPRHRPHRLLQIRRYVYHDVVRVDDLEKLIDCSSVQLYTTNGAKVVFLNKRALSRPFRGSGNACRSCDRPLQDRYLFCSLSCKVKLLLRSEVGLARELRECQFLSLPSTCDLDEGHLTPDSILESTSATSSGSSATGGGLEPRNTRSTAGMEPLVRRRGSCAGRPLGPEVVNRRKKGIPMRAPLL
uniref:Uncharacterized protein LOC105054027 n=1 Tax=Elaeis guineensis var. tenera TaxID=51953 RepID=A0A6I9S5E7_ELAGV|nr:uncharacterized protein LOC105054027 [Elaeis guineensis]